MDPDVNLRQRTEANEDDLLLLDLLESGAESRIANYKSYIDRYFTKYYKINFRQARNDHLILMHSNKIAVCSLAPSHPVLDTSRYRVVRVEYLQTVNDEMSGKHKHNAKNLNQNQPICRLHAKVLKTDESAEDTLEPKEAVGDERIFVFYSFLNAKLLETNDRLAEQPELVQTKPATEGFIAIMMPKLDNLKDQLKELIDHDEYIKSTTQNITT